MMPPNVFSPFKVLASAVVITQLAACSTTYVSSLWKDPTYQVKPHKIMIIGIAKSPANKRTLEDDFASGSSYKARMPSQATRYCPTTRTATRRHRGQDEGARGRCGTHHRIASRKTVYRNLLEVYAPPQSYSTWQNYYEYGYGNITSPNYVEETKYAVMETNMYDAGTTSSSGPPRLKPRSPVRTKNSIKSYVDVMVKSMTKQKLLMRNDDEGEKSMETVGQEVGKSKHDSDSWARSSIGWWPRADEVGTDAKTDYRRRTRACQR